MLNASLLTREEQDRLLAEYKARHAKAGFRSLEALLTGERGFGLTTATPLQRAICRLVDGVPLGDLADHPHVVESIGDTTAIDGIRPRKVVLVAGIRTFKSLLASCVAFYASQTVDVAHLGEGEIPRFSVVSIKKDLGDVIFNHLVGNVMARPGLRERMVGEPSGGSAMFLHPSGRLFEVKVVAGARAGASLVARWSGGGAFDEAPRMVGNESGVINLDDARDAIDGRLLPGAQTFEIGSPWAPYGPVYDTVMAHEGKPTEDVLVIRAQAHWLNPYWWTKARRDALERSNPVAYQTDVLAQFADAQETMLPSEAVRACMRSGPLRRPREAGHGYVAAMDPATRSNAWTLVIADRFEDKKRIVYAKQWQGTPVKPLSPKAVLGEVATICHSYGIDWAYTDQWSADAIVDLGHDQGLSLIIEPWNAANKFNAFQGLRANILDGRIELPPDNEVTKDLGAVKKVVTASGVTIHLPKTGDGRHADYAPAIARALFRWIDEETELPPMEGTPEHSKWVEDQIIAREIEELKRKQDDPWGFDEMGGDPWLG